jgi:hypothetical protein
LYITIIFGEFSAEPTTRSIRVPVSELQRMVVLLCPHGVAAGKCRGEQRDER